MHRCDPWRVVILIAVALVLALPVGVIAQEGPRQKRPRRPRHPGTASTSVTAPSSVSCAGTAPRPSCSKQAVGTPLIPGPAFSPKSPASRVCSYDRAGLGRAIPPRVGCGPSRTASTISTRYSPPRISPARSSWPVIRSAV